MSDNVVRLPTQIDLDFMEIKAALDRSQRGLDVDYKSAEESLVRLFGACSENARHAIDDLPQISMADGLRMRSGRTSKPTTALLRRPLSPHERPDPWKLRSSVFWF